MEFISLVLANVSPSKLRVVEGSGLSENFLLSKALSYVRGSSNSIIALSNSLLDLNLKLPSEPNVLIRYLPNTQGALATIGLLLDAIPENFPVVVVPINSQISESIEDFILFMSAQSAAVGMAVIESSSDELSYVREVNGKVIEIHEKEVVGKLGITGHYYFANKQLIADCLHWALLNDIRKDGLLYIAPSMNYCITKGLNVIPLRVSQQGYKRHDYGSEA